MDDDFSSDTTTTGRLTVGGTATGALERYGDSDWFKISLEAGKTYIFSAAGTYIWPNRAISYLSYDSLFLFDGQGKLINNLTRDFGDALPLQYRPNVSGDYYLSLTNQEFGSFYGTGGYTLSAVTQTQDDLPSDTSTTAVLQAGGSVSAKFDVAGDRDWFKFHAEVGQHYTFTGTGGSGLVPIYNVLVYDANGNLLNANTRPFEPLSTGDYYIAAVGGEAGNYQLNAGTMNDDYPANASTTALLQPGGQFSGGLQYAGDIDEFHLQLQAGTIYTVDLKLDTLDKDNVYMTVRDANGQAITGTATHTASGYQLVLSPQASGDYYLQVAGAANYPNYNWPGTTHGPYTLSMAGNSTQDDYGDTVATATTVSIGTPVQGVLQTSSDVDMFGLSLTGGVTYTFQLQHGSHATPAFGLYDSKGNGPTTPGYSSDGYYYFTPATSGMYYAGVAANSNPDIPSSYTFTAQQTADDYTASASGAGRLAIGGSASGTLENSADRDWFAVQLNAGGSYVFALNGSPEGAGTLQSLLYGGSQFRLVDSSGKELATASPADSSHTSGLLSYSPSASGTYYVELSAAGSNTGSYQLVSRGGTHDDFGDDRAHATKLSDGIATPGRLESGGDIDVFRLDLTAGNNYAIDLKASSQSDSSWLNNVQLSITTDNGYPDYSVRNGNSQGLEMYRSFYATMSGSYYITVTHGASDTPRDYVLTASASAADDFLGTWNSTDGLKENSQIHGVIGIRGDVDWIKMHMDAGKTYSFTLHGAASGNGTLDVGSISQLTLHNNGSSAALVSASLNNQGEPTMSYEASRTGDYFVEANGGALGTGTYTISTTTVGNDTTPPTLVSIAPSSGNAKAGLLDDIVLTFSEPVMQSYNAYIGLLSGTQSWLVQGDGMNQGHVAGNQIFIHPAYGLKPDTTYTLQLSQGGIQDLGGNAYAGQLSFTFSTVSNTVSGGAGNDKLSGTGSGQTIDGGSGVDTVNYAGQLNRYTLSNVNGQFSVKYDSGMASDALSNVERLHFADADIALDIHGNAGQAYRVYQAAFNRAPDKAGLGYWIAAIDQGTSLVNVASSFIASAEFKQLYGAAPSDAEFVNQLYHNVLHRDGDPAGVAYWNTALHNGGARADLLASFSESAENQAALIGTITNGISYTPYG